jgi:hypothetical protein
MPGRLFRRIGSFRLSGVGLALVGALAVCVALGVLASGITQEAGWVGVVIVLIALVGGVPYGRMGGAGSAGMTSTWRGRTITYAEPEVLDEASADETSWQRERERRERDAES